MDRLTFTTEIIKAICWPVAAIIMMALARRPLGKLVPLLEEFEFKGAKAKFRKADKAVDEAVRETVKFAQVSPVVDANEPFHLLTNALNETENDVRLLSISPDSAVANAWQRFEFAVEEATQRLQLSTPSGSSRFHQQVEKFRQEGWLTSGLVKLISTLNSLRAVSLHGAKKGFVYAEAIRFLMRVEPLIRYFEMLRPNSPKVPPT